MGLRTVILLVMFCFPSLCYGQPEPQVKLSELSDWLKSEEAIAYGKIRHDQRIVQVIRSSQEHAKQLSQSRSKNAIRDFQKSVAGVNAEVERLRKVKQPLYIPLLVMNDQLASSMGCVGRLSSYRTQDAVAIYRIINSHELVGSYPVHTAAALPNSVPSSGYFWLGEIDSTKNLPLNKENAKPYQFNKPVYVVVDSQKDYPGLSSNGRIPYLKVVDLRSIIKDCGAQE